MKVIAYTRVSTAEQGISGAGLGAQAEAIRCAALARGWDLLQTYTDAGASGSTLKRPELEKALAAVAAGEADALVVAKLDRLSRSLVDFSSLMERSRSEGWAVIALDLGVDTSTPAGEMMANVMASFAQYERRLIGQRTRDALAVKKANGDHLGRRRDIADEVVSRILSERRAGATLDRIAEGLNRDAIPTARGGLRWYGSTVGKVLAYAS